jgi:hypothetical protein
LHACEQKCATPSCPAEGLPEPGYGFFVCGECLDKLGASLEMDFLRHVALDVLDEGWPPAESV